MWFTQNGRKLKGREGNDTFKVTCVFSFWKKKKTLTKRQTNITDQVNTDMSRAFCGLLPLQSTKGDMHTIRTIDIDLHKQRVIYAYIYGSDLRECTNEQAGYCINWHAKNSHNSRHAMDHVRWRQWPQNYNGNSTTPRTVQYCITVCIQVQVQVQTTQPQRKVGQVNSYVNVPRGLINLQRIIIIRQVLPYLYECVYEYLAPVKLATFVILKYAIGWHKQMFYKWWVRHRSIVQVLYELVVRCAKCTSVLFQLDKHNFLCVYSSLTICFYSIFRSMPAPVHHYNRAVEI